MIPTKARHPFLIGVDDYSTYDPQTRTTSSAVSAMFVPSGTCA
jgi:uncharacterized short protein YbdD (DUF466 family)